jgi:hypothetical protein
MFTTSMHRVWVVRCALVLAVTCVAWGAATESAHAVPDTISFSAAVHDERGPVAGAVNTTFRIFDAPTGGEPIWEEHHPSVPVEEGIFNVELGSLAEEVLDELVFDGSRLYVEIVIEGDVMQQRIAIQAVPYAYRAATADTLDGHEPDDFLLRSGALLCPTGQKMRGIDGASGNAVCVSEQLATSGGGLSLVSNAYSIASAGVTAGKIASGAVTWSKIADGAVTSSKIASGAVTRDKLGFDSTPNLSTPYFANRDGGGITTILLRSASNSFCALTRVLMTEADNRDEWGECYVGIQDGNWILRSRSYSHPDRTDPIVYCGAQCISW